MNMKQISEPFRRRVDLAVGLIEQIFAETEAHGPRVQVRSTTSDGASAWFVVDRETQNYFRVNEPRPGLATWPVEASN